MYDLFFISNSISNVSLANIATAQLVEYAAMQSQTANGEGFTFMFNPFLRFDVSLGASTIEARGDYFEKSTECLGFDIAGIFFQAVVAEGDVAYIYSDGNDDRVLVGTDLDCS